MLRATVRSMVLIAACALGSTVSSVSQAADMVEMPGYHTQRATPHHRPRRLVRTDYSRPVALDCQKLVVEYRYNGTREIINMCEASRPYRPYRH